MIRVCYNCYCFYYALEKEILNKDGIINYKNVRKMTDPSYKELLKRKQEAKEILKRVKSIIRHQHIRKYSLIK